MSRFAPALVAILVVGCGAGGSVNTIAGSTEAGSADGQGHDARFRSLSGIVVSEDGTIFVTDAVGPSVRRIEAGGDVSTVAGGGASGLVDGPPDIARFFYATALAVDRDGSLVVGEGGNKALRRVDPTTGVVTTIAGGEAGYLDGPIDSARFGAISGIAIDPITGTMYVSDFENHAIRRIDTVRLVVETLAGNGSAGYVDGPGTAARFHSPTGLALDSEGTLWVADTFNHVVRRVSPDGTVTTMAGSAGSPGYAEGSGDRARFARPWGLVADGDVVYVADSWNQVIRSVDARGTTRLVAGLPRPSSPLPGGEDGPLDEATFRLPTALAVRAGRILVAESTRVREVVR